jgi:hypothetical protein
LFQEADGQSGAYQTVLLVHDCRGPAGADAQCRGCGMRPRKTGARHPCPRVVREGETITCAECGTLLGKEHVLPWPEQGPWT